MNQKKKNTPNSDQTHVGGLLQVDNSPGHHTKFCDPSSKKVGAMSPQS